MEINEKVQVLRKSKGISQTFMAEHLRISISGYNMKEHGRRPISIKELEMISDLLGVNVAYFFEEKFHVKCNFEKEVG